MAKKDQPMYIRYGIQSSRVYRVVNCSLPQWHILSLHQLSGGGDKEMPVTTFELSAMGFNLFQDANLPSLKLSVIYITFSSPLPHLQTIPFSSHNSLCSGSLDSAGSVSIIFVLFWVYLILTLQTWQESWMDSKDEDLKC